MEAMALGVPVIARLIPGNAAVVTHMVYRLSIHKEGFTSDTGKRSVVQKPRRFHRSSIIVATR